MEQKIDLEDEEREEEGKGREEDRGIDEKKSIV
jgi:hypothetical protein